jgi:hypothetical protein
MNETKIYIKGKAGFKPAVKAKLGNAWTHSDGEINVDTIMLVTAVESRLDALKASVGNDLALVYELQFLTTLDDNDTLELSKGQSSKGPLKMSIWISEHSNIKARVTQLPQRDPVLPVF